MIYNIIGCNSTSSYSSLEGMIKHLLLLLLLCFVTYSSSSGLSTTVLAASSPPIFKEGNSFFWLAAPISFCVKSLHGNWWLKMRACRIPSAAILMISTVVHCVVSPFDVFHLLQGILISFHFYLFFFSCCRIDECTFQAEHSASSPTNSKWNRLEGRNESLSSGPTASKHFSFYGHAIP